MSTPEGAPSPRIAALERDFAERGASALTEFWSEIESTGSPLIEPLPPDDRHSLVTFLWRAEGSDDTVALLGGPLDPGILAPLEQVSGTDVLHQTYRLPNDQRNAYWLIPDPPRSLIPESQEEFDAMSERRSQPGFLGTDPLNLLRVPFLMDPQDHTSKTLGPALMELPRAPAQAYAAERPDTSRGTLVHHRVPSHQLGAERSTWVYTPPGYDRAGPPCDLLIVFDGATFLGQVGVPTILDNLASEGLITPTVAVLVDNPADTRSDELACGEAFADFLAGELLPWVASEYTVTNQAERTTLAGSSYGGLAASFGALRYPQHFGNVLAQSGSYWWHPSYSPDQYIPIEQRQSGWLTSQFASAQTLPVRFYLDAGHLEHSEQVVSLRNSVRDFRDVLQSNGYDVTHQEFNGGHAYACWRGTFSDGLLALLSTAEDKD